MGTAGAIGLEMLVGAARISSAGGNTITNAPNNMQWWHSAGRDSQLRGRTEWRFVVTWVERRSARPK
jgi:hypothetical protein